MTNTNCRRLCQTLFNVPEVMDYIQNYNLYHLENGKITYDSQVNLFFLKNYLISLIYLILTKSSCVFLRVWGTLEDIMWKPYRVFQKSWCKSFGLLCCSAPGHPTLTISSGMFEKSSLFEEYTTFWEIGDGMYFSNEGSFFTFFAPLQSQKYIPPLWATFAWRIRDAAVRYKPWAAFCSPRHVSSRCLLSLSAPLPHFYQSLLVIKVIFRATIFLSGILSATSDFRDTCVVAVGEGFSVRTTPYSAKGRWHFLQPVSYSGDFSRTGLFSTPFWELVFVLRSFP